MDINASRRHLSLGIFALCCIQVVGCTEVAYARIRISPATGNEILHSEIDTWLVTRKWQRTEQGYVLAGETGRYLDLSEISPKKYVLACEVVGANNFRQSKLQIYRELVQALVEKFGAAVDYDKVSNKGQALF